MAAAVLSRALPVPASYANFLIINGAVLLPTFRRRGAGGCGARRGSRGLFSGAGDHSHRLPDLVWDSGRCIVSRSSSRPAQAHGGRPSGSRTGSLCSDEGLRVGARGLCGPSKRVGRPSPLPEIQHLPKGATLGDSDRSRHCLLSGPVSPDAPSGLSRQSNPSPRFPFGGVTSRFDWWPGAGAGRSVLRPRVQIPVRMTSCSAQSSFGLTEGRRHCPRGHHH